MEKKWLYDSPFNWELVSDPSKPIEGFQLPRDLWMKLNRLHTGQGKCLDCLFKWNLTSSPLFDCGHGSQTMAHIVCSCQLRRFCGDYAEFCKALSQREIDWIRCLDLNL